MRVGIFSQDQERTVKSVKLSLESHGIESFLLGNKQVPNLDYVVVTGGDRGVRNYFHHELNSAVPVLGINEFESSGYLAQIDLKEFPTILNRLKKSDFTIEHVTLIGVKIHGKGVYPVLNDIAMFSSKSATLFE